MRLVKMLETMGYWKKGMIYNMDYWRSDRFIKEGLAYQLKDLGSRGAGGYITKLNGIGLWRKITKKQSGQQNAI